MVEQAFTLPHAALKDGVSAYRTGNSLTANAAVYMPYVEEAADIKPSARSVEVISAGAPTKYLWDTFIGDDATIPEKAPRKLANDNAPFEYLVVQPFWPSGVDDAEMRNELDYTSKLYDLLLANSPKAELWLYVQWTFWFLPSELERSGTAQFSTTATQWRDSMEKYIKSCEQLRAQLQAKYPARTVRIIPCASALLVLQQAIVEGRVPGMTSFELEVMQDGIHLS